MRREKLHAIDGKIQKYKLDTQYLHIYIERANKRNLLARVSSRFYSQTMEEDL